MSAILTENILVLIGIESYQKGLAPLDGGSPQISGGAQHHLQQIFFCGFVFFQIKLCNLFALHNHYFAGLGYQLSRFVGAQFGVGVGLGFDGDVMIRKEPLRAVAAGSAFAVIIPIDTFGHGCSPGWNE